MHGQQTLKHLNDKAVADAIMAKYKADKTNPEANKALEDKLVSKVK